MSWSARPFVRIFFPLAAGIFLAKGLSSVREISLLWLVALIAVLGLSAFILYKKNRSWRWRWTNGLLINLILVAAGIFVTNLKLKTESFVFTDKEESYVAEIVNEPVITEKSVKMILRLDQMVSKDTIAVNGNRAMAFFQSDSLSQKLQYGDIVVFKGKPLPPDAPKNPDEFNYASFLKLNNVQAMVFVRQDKWNLLGSNENSVFVFAARIRNYLLKALQENGVRGNDYTVAAAILLGYDQLMDPELEQEYVTAGAMHILCVSGLHVGIIYLVLNFVLGFLRRNRAQKVIKAILLLLLIWFYAFLTGLSPSVMRASVMISLFIVAALFSRYKDVYNTLAASAVLMLLFNPLLIFNVGFQLSYSAVLGILMFYQPVYNIIYIKNKAADKIWSVVAVSTAAQLGTFPLAAHYFHFFPPYFWLTNIFIFPLSFAIIGTGMAFMVFSWVPVVSGILGTILSGFVYLLNYVIGLVKYLPFNGIHDLYYPWTKVVLMYALILFAIPLTLDRKIKMAIPALTTILLLLSLNTIHKYRVHTQKRMVVYSISGHSAYDFISGNRHVLLADSMLWAKPKKLDFHLENSRINWGLAKNTLPVDKAIEDPVLNLYYDGTFGVFGEATFMVWSRKRLYSTSNPVHVDYVITAGKGRTDLDLLKDMVKFDRLIIDTSVPHKRQNKITEQAEELNISYFDVKKQGAFIVEMRE